MDQYGIESSYDLNKLLINFYKSSGLNLNFEVEILNVADRMWSVQIDSA